MDTTSPLDKPKSITSSRTLLEQLISLLRIHPDAADLVDFDPIRFVDDSALLSGVLAGLASSRTASIKIEELSNVCFAEAPQLVCKARRDLIATASRNMEPGGVAAALMFYRGFHALLAYRVANHLWNTQRKVEALALKAVLERVLSTDIHPGASIGAGVWFDHGLCVVIGETAVVEDDVSMWHSVTLGSTLKETGPDRHPKVRQGCTIGAGATLLGAIEIGPYAVVAAGAVVLSDVPAHTTVAGIPARSRSRTAESFKGFEPPNGDVL
jgi:serine O-acetyltransferase